MAEQITYVTEKHEDETGLEPSPPPSQAPISEDSSGAKIYRYSMHLLDVKDILEENNPEWIRNNKLRFRGEEYLHLLLKATDTDIAVYGFQYDPEGEISQEAYQALKATYEVLK